MLERASPPGQRPARQRGIPCESKSPGISRLIDNTVVRFKEYNSAMRTCAVGEGSRKELSAVAKRRVARGSGKNLHTVDPYGVKGIVT
jgi:hypothetical protein